MSVGRWAMLLVLMTVFAAPVRAVIVIDDDTSVPGDILRITTPFGYTYGVNDYGSSSLWLIPDPGFNDVSKDLLSGDNAGALHFNVNGQAAGGNGWITAVLDAGALRPFYVTGAAWEIDSPIVETVPGSQTISSVINNDAGLRITILTTAGAEIRQDYFIQNIGNQTVTDLQFYDYANIHPNSSEPPNHLRGKVFVGDEELPLGGLVTALEFIGDQGHPSFVADAAMFGERNPDAVMIGLIDDVIAAVEANALSGFDNGGLPWDLNNFGDYAGAFMWDLGDIDPEQTVSFTVYKRQTNPIIPEPGTGLLVLGISSLLLLKRK